MTIKVSLSVLHPCSVTADPMTPVTQIMARGNVFIIYKKQKN